MRSAASPSTSATRRSCRRARPAIVERLHVRAHARPRCAQGQPLAELYVPDWVAAQEEFLSRQRACRAASLRALVDAARAAHAPGRHDRRADSRSSRRAARCSRASRSPRRSSGVRHRADGARGHDGDAGRDAVPHQRPRPRVWVNAEVPESQAALVRPGRARRGDAARRCPARPSRAGCRRSCPRSTRRRARSRRAIELANPGGRLVPGMFVQMHVHATATRAQGAAGADRGGDPDRPAHAS